MGGAYYLPARLPKLPVQKPGVVGPHKFLKSQEVPTARHTTCMVYHAIIRCNDYIPRCND
jgi:hypothetical protein